MPCRHYKDALIEAAASAATPQGELRAHLAECASCREAFANEQSLFASIDSSLHAAVNTEISASLLPRMRASVNGAVHLSRSWFANGLLWAGAAVVLVAWLAARGVVHRNAENQPPAFVASKSSPPASVRSPQLGVVPLAKGAVARLPHARALPNRARTAVANPSIPEVLVPRDQQVLLAQYAQQWQQHRFGTLVAGDADWTTLTPLQPSPIQINPLDVKLLKEVESK